MRKFCIFAITLILALSLCACGSSQEAEEYRSTQVSEAMTTAKEERGEVTMFKTIYSQDIVPGSSHALRVVEFIPNGSLFIMTDTGDICPILDWCADGSHPFDMDDLNCWLRS